MEKRKRILDKEKKLNPYYAKCLDTLQKENLLKLTSSTLEVFMFNSEDYSLELFTNNHTRHSSKIYNASSTILSSGQDSPMNKVEELLNWRTKNSLAQNKALNSIQEK
mgnify:CR=1 FL=1